MASVPQCFSLTAASSLNKYPAKQHAQDVAQKLGVTKGLIYLPGQPTIWQEDSDSPYPFRQRRYFYYLSGVDESDCHLTYDIGKDHLTLYIPAAQDSRWIIYNGRGLTIAEAYDKYDVDTVKHAPEVSDAVQRWTKLHPRVGVFILHPTQEAFPNQNKLPQVDYTKLQFAIDRCRVIKDPHEIELIRKANDISAEAHRTVLTNIVGLQNEAQVEAIFKEICTARMAKNQAYEVIAASGENAATLHYIKNNEPLAGRQLLCLDAGCEWELYASDVTRTFPLSGSWPSKEANAIYDLVQSMQTACIERVKPGVRFLDLHRLAHQIAVRGLLQLGILHNAEEKDILEAGTSLAFFPHGLGHHMGLEVHDVSDVPLNSLEASYEASVDPTMAVLLSGGACRAPVDIRSGGLEDGMVVTIEPGIYFNRYALEHVYLASPVHSKFINKEVLETYYPVGGVRIEDDILVTKTGYENLTTAPKGEEMLNLIRLGSRSVGAQRQRTSSVALSTGVTAQDQIPTAPPHRTPALLGSNRAAAVIDRGFASTLKPVSRRIFTGCAYCRKRKLRCQGYDQDLPGYIKPGTTQSGQSLCMAELRECIPGPSKSGYATASPVTSEDTIRSATGTQPEIADPLPERLQSSLLDGFQNALKNGGATERGRLQEEIHTERPNVYGYDSADVTTFRQSLRTIQSMTRDENSLYEPSVPGKTPQVPQKPLAYRASIASFHDAVHRLAQGPQDSNHLQSPRWSSSDVNFLASYNDNASRPDVDATFHHHGVGVAATSRLCGLRRAQSQLVPTTQRSVPSPHPPRSSFVSSQASKVDQDVILRIAAVTATYIHSIPQNRHKNVNGDEIRRILEANPTLADLCRMLKAIDLTVRELDLADVLLDAVPSIDFQGLARPLPRSRESESLPRIARAPLEQSMRDCVRPIRAQSLRNAHHLDTNAEQSQANSWDSCADFAAQAHAGSEARLSGTHEWVEQRMRRMMSDNFLVGETRRR